MDKKLLMKATTPDEDATPGWMYHSIAEMTQKDEKTCEGVRNWLIKRLNVNNSFVKKKVLVIIKTVAQKGNLNFSREIVRQTEDIKQYRNYKGPVDPLRGETLNMQVRKACDEALEAIFARAEKRTYEDNGSSGFSSTGEPEVQTISERFGKWAGLGSGQRTTNTDDYSNISVESQISSGGKYAGLSSSEGRIGEMPNKDKKQSWGEYITSYLPAKGKYGNNFDDGSNTSFISETYQSPISGGVEPESYKSNTSPTYPSADTNVNYFDSTQNKIKASKSGMRESKLVNDLTNASGVKTKPTSSELIKFCNKCQTLDSENVARLLDEKLNHHMYQSRLKSLCGIESLIKSDNKEIIQYFEENYQNIQKSTEAVQSAVASKATKVLKLLGHDTSSISEPSVSKTTNTTKQQQAEPTKKTSKKVNRKQKPRQVEEDNSKQENLLLLEDEETPQKEKTVSNDNGLDSFLDGLTFDSTNIDENNNTNTMNNNRAKTTQNGRNERSNSSSILEQFLGSPSEYNQTSPNTQQPIIYVVNNTVPSIPNQYGPPAHHNYPPQYHQQVNQHQSYNTSHQNYRKPYGHNNNNPNTTTKPNGFSFISDSPGSAKSEGDKKQSDSHFDFIRGHLNTK